MDTVSSAQKEDLCSTYASQVGGDVINNTFDLPNGDLGAEIRR